MKINQRQLEREIERQGITGADLARMTGLNASTISNTRAKGSCSYETIAKIASALQTNINKFIPEIGEPVKRIQSSGWLAAANRMGVR